MMSTLATACVVFAVIAPVPKGGPTTAERLLGRWELLKSNDNAPTQPHFATFEKDGTMTLEVGVAGAVTKYTGSYTVDAQTIDYKLTMNGFEKTEKLTIKAFDGDDLTTADPDGIVEVFKRVKVAAPKK
jgi:uncharacterized protein (TIGR03066 family)